MKFEPKIIKSFFDKKEILFLKNYCLMQHRKNEEFEEKINTRGVVTSVDTQSYADPVFETYLIIKTKIIEENLNLKLLPTYSYWRMYTLGSYLKKHKDREACEISLTAKIGSCDTSWPIYVNDIAYNLDEGDALVYPGIEALHWREEFTGDWNAQVFLHWVDANGINSKFANDNRLYIGEDIE
jgi:hypothetical protein